MKQKIMTGILLFFFVIALVLGISIVKRGTEKEVNASVHIVQELPSEETDILLDESGTRGYVHGVWGFGRNLSERSNILEQEPGCGVRTGNRTNKNLKILSFGKWARIMEQERDTGEVEMSENPFSLFPALEKLEVEEGNPYLKSEQGILYEVDPGNGNVRSVYGCMIGKKGSVKILDGTRSLGAGAFYGCHQITSVTIPGSLEKIYPGALENMKGCEKYEVDKSNPNYTSVDGVLYTKNKEKVIAYPLGKNGGR